jgi:putative cardiolipin synthase
LTGALLRAADRGVHQRMLLDDGETVRGDEQILALAAHPQVEIRVFNPFAYRGHIGLVRAVEFMFAGRRLDYRMHNKLFIADNASALIGGRNIGDEYFQVDPDRQFADDDGFVVGPTIQKLSGTFDDWNDALATPVEGLKGGKPTQAALETYRAKVFEEWRQAQDNNVCRAAQARPLCDQYFRSLPERRCALRALDVDMSPCR